MKSWNPAKNPVTSILKSARLSFRVLDVEILGHLYTVREENPKTSPENLINTFCGLRGSMSALSFPKLPGDVKD